MGPHIGYHIFLIELDTPPWDHICVLHTAAPFECAAVASPDNKNPGAPGVAFMPYLPTAPLRGLIYVMFYDLCHPSAKLPGLVRQHTFEGVGARLPGLARQTPLRACG